MVFPLFRRGLCGLLNGYVDPKVFLHPLKYEHFQPSELLIWNVLKGTYWVPWTQPVDEELDSLIPDWLASLLASRLD